MAITTEQIMAAKLSLEQEGLCPGPDDIARALEAAERVAPIAAPKAFEVTDKLVYLATSCAYSWGEQSIRRALKAVSAELGKQQQAQEQPAGEVTAPSELLGFRVGDRVQCVGSSEIMTIARFNGQLVVSERGTTFNVIDARHVGANEGLTAGEPERVARPFELDAAAYDAMHGQIEHNGPYTRVGMVARALLRATKTLAPTERENELEAALKLSHEATEAAVTEWNAKEAELAQAKETIASLQLGKIDSDTELERAEDELANEQQCNQALSEMLTARDSELAELRAKLEGAQEVYRIRGDECEEQHRVIVQLRAKLAECDHQLAAGEGHVLVLPLSAHEEHCLSRMEECVDMSDECMVVVGAFRKRFPRPTPVDPVQQVIEEMRANELMHPLEQANLAVWADRLEAALAQKEQR